MQRNIELEATIVAKYAAVAPVLDERSRRVWAATESLAIGYGGDALVSAALGWRAERYRRADRNWRAAVPRLTRCAERAPDGRTWNTRSPVSGTPWRRWSTR